jgi:hypothetical protein
MVTELGAHHSNPSFKDFPWQWSAGRHSPGCHRKIVKTKTLGWSRSSLMTGYQSFQFNGEGPKQH